MGLAVRKSSALLAPFTAHLSNYAALGEEDLNGLGWEAADLQLHAIREPLLSGPEEVRLVTSGWAGVSRVLADGRRQILHVAIAGDIVNAPPIAEGEVSALTTARTIDAGPLLEWLRSQAANSGVVRAWTLAQAEHQRLLYEQIARLGAMTAYERAASFITELLARHQRAGLSDGRRMPWPATQEVIADVLGLSMVHVNRVLQQLRRDGMIETRSGMLIVCDPERLAAAGFAPA
jgi:CRP-like cAMP-binding protein